MKKKNGVKEELEAYIKTVRTWTGKEEEFDWHVYEKHKKRIEEICAGDWKLYDWAIEKLTRKLDI